MSYFYLFIYFIILCHVGFNVFIEIVLLQCFLFIVRLILSILGHCAKTFWAQDVDLNTKREREVEQLIDDPNSHVPDNLFHVERGHQSDNSYEGQQRAVEDSHPGHCLNVHQIQHIEMDKEALFPQQPGQQG